MKRLGLTLIEMLVALALLSAIVAATTAWMQIAGELASPTGRVKRERELVASEGVLDLIQHDLQCGDLAPDEKAGSRKSHARITVNNGVLGIETRSPGIGAARHEYRFDSITGELTLVQLAGDTQRMRPLIDKVSHWNCTIDEQHAWLDVSIRTVEGPTLSQRYVLP